MASAGFAGILAAMKAIRDGVAPATHPAFDMAWPRRPRVSALVAAWNEAGNIDKHISSFQTLAYSERELVLCAGGQDGTHRLAQRWASPQVRVLEQQPGEGKQAALRRCLEMASGEVIMLTDADCEFSDTAFLKLIEPLAKGTAQAVTGVAAPKPDQQSNALVRYQWCVDELWAHKMPPTLDGMLGRNCALFRTVLDDIGGFTTPALTGTDYVMSRRLTAAGFKIHAAPKSRMATEYPASPRAYLRMWRRWNKNLLIHGFRFRYWKDVKGVLSAAGLYGLMLALPAATFVLGSVGWGATALLFGAAVASRMRRYLQGARLRGDEVKIGSLARVPLYTGLDITAVFLAIYDAINPRLRSRW